MMKNYFFLRYKLLKAWKVLLRSEKIIMSDFMLLFYMDVSKFLLINFDGNELIQRQKLYLLNKLFNR